MSESTATPLGFHALPVPLAQLSLAAVLKCGQSFRWSIYPLSPTTQDKNAPTHEYRLCLRDRVVCLRQSSETIFYRSLFPSGGMQNKEAETLAWIKDYFQLDVDLVELYRRWGSADSVFQRVQDRFQGIRMLRQDPFENLISFICSSNNNISRITKMVKSLCITYAPPLLTLPLPEGSSTDDEEAFHPFPSPSALAASDVTARLRALGFGYRADFIQKTAAMLVERHGVTPDPHSGLEASEEWLLSLRKLATTEARAELLKFMGVGRKVADCILLMSLDKKEVIPVDTHVYQIAVKYYGHRGTSKGTMSPKVYEEVNAKLASVWGDYSGWAHSVLFTAELKSFSSHGVVTPSKSTMLELTPDQHSSSSDGSLVMDTSSTSTSTPRSGKRKSREQSRPMTKDDQTLVQLVAGDGSDETNMIDRVKRRRR